MTSKLERARHTIANMRARSDEAVANGVTTGVTVLAAGGMSYANARFADDGRLKVAGVDADLGLGLLFTALGFAGLGASKSGKSEMTSLVLHGLGNGFLSTYAVYKAAEMGRDAKMHASGRVEPSKLASGSQRIPHMGIYGRAAAEGRV